MKSLSSGFPDMAHKLHNRMLVGPVRRRKNAPPRTSHRLGQLEGELASKEGPFGPGRALAGGEKDQVAAEYKAPPARKASDPDYGPGPDRSALDAQLQAIPEATRERYMKEWVALQARLGKPVGTEEELRASFYLPT